MEHRRRTAVKAKRVRQVKIEIFVIVSVLVLAAAAIFIHYINQTQKKAEAVEAAALEAEVTTDHLTTEPVAVEPEEPEEPEIRQETGKERVERVRREATQAGYPESVIELLEKNPETVEFVENYGTMKDTTPAKRIAEFKKGQIPQLLQWDARWGYAPYGTDIVAVCGCGPTCLSMVFSYLTEDATLTPARMARYGTNHNYITEENDTKWSFMTGAGKNWGIRCREVSLTEQEIKEELQAGHPIICSVGPGDFTKIGHFIVLAGYENGKVIVHDPFSQKNSDKRWKFEKFEDQIKAMWVFQKE